MVKDARYTSTPEPPQNTNITQADNNPTYAITLRNTTPEEIINYTDPTITEYCTVFSYSITNLPRKIATRKKLLDLLESFEIPTFKVKCYSNRTALLENYTQLPPHVPTLLPLRSGFPYIEIPGTRIEPYTFTNRNYKAPSTSSTSTLSDTTTQLYPNNTTAQNLEPPNLTNTPHKSNESNESTYTNMNSNNNQLTTPNTETLEETKAHANPNTTTHHADINGQPPTNPTPHRPTAPNNNTRYCMRNIPQSITTQKQFYNATKPLNLALSNVKFNFNHTALLESS
ncbi:hypothetical protein FQA39_LY06920 [Lamprigera yunnana]|nr:hypothetical protein FQA39_LY06920 [Lamprigera yunnana]